MFDRFFLFLFRVSAHLKIYPGPAIRRKQRMKKIFATIFLLPCLFAGALAQSGRRIVPPEPAADTTDEDKAIDYSESVPRKPRARYIPPSFGRDEDKSSGKDPLPPVLSGSTPEQIDDADLVKIETNLITIPVSVFDRDGLYIPGLKQEDFKIFEDGKEQKIAYFGTTDKPFTVILLLDTSPSTEYKIEEIQAAAKAFVDQLKAQDSVMVIEFDGNVHVLTESTSDRQRIYKAIRKADFGGGTSLYDAVDFSLRKRLSKVLGRKAIVLFTDGVDTTSSKAGYDSTLNQAEEADALIFPIYYNTFFDNNKRIGSSFPFPFPGQGARSQRGSSASEYALGRKYLDELSEVTGGRVFRPEATPGGLTAAFEGIAEELRRQYNIGYVPDEEGKPGQRKQIKVRVDRPNLVLRSRDSYIVGAAAKSETPSK